MPERNAGSAEAKLYITGTADLRMSDAIIEKLNEMDSKLDKLLEDIIDEEKEKTYSQEKTAERR